MEEDCGRGQGLNWVVAQRSMDGTDDEFGWL
jgi:hypothetical protein